MHPGMIYINPLRPLCCHLISSFPTYTWSVQIHMTDSRETFESLRSSSPDQCSTMCSEPGPNLATDSGLHEVASYLPTKPSVVQSVPEELWAMIATQLVVDERKDALLQFCRTSRMLHRGGSSALYRTVTIDSADRFELFQASALAASELSRVNPNLVNRFAWTKRMELKGLVDREDLVS